MSGVTYGDRPCNQCGSTYDLVWRQFKDGALIRHVRECRDQEACQSRVLEAARKDELRKELQADMMTTEGWV